jgi:hypothetical protein
MYRLRHLNLDKAIQHFLDNVERLERLPLISDEDMALIYGDEVMESIAVLSRYNSQEKACVKCAKKCCPLVRCELYDAGFSQCPILPFRPAICRMHYCDKFAVGDASFVKEFADIYLNALLEAKIQGSRKVDLFDSPPLNKFAPELVADISPLLNAFKDGTLDEASALREIHNKAARFRTSTAALDKAGKTDKSLEIVLAEAKLAIKGR